MDNSSLAHSKWNCKYHIVFCTKIQKANNIWKDKSRYRVNTKKIM